MDPKMSHLHNNSSNFGDVDNILLVDRPNNTSIPRYTTFCLVVGQDNYPKPTNPPARSKIYFYDQKFKNNKN